MHVATDVPILTLVVSAVVLLASTALLTYTVPGISWPRWRRGGRRRARDRRVVTGRPPALPAGPIPPAIGPHPLAAARQSTRSQDVPRRADRLTDAEATIEHLLETDPDQLARLMMQWIRDDRGRREPSS